MFELIGYLIGLIIIAVTNIFKFLFRTKIIRVFMIAGLIIFVPLLFLKCAEPNLYDTVTKSAVSAVYSTTLYGKSKDVYLNSIIHGSSGVAKYNIQKDTPYFSSIIPDDKLEEKEPLGILPVDTEVEIQNIFTRKSEEENSSTWSRIFFINEDKPQYAYALLPVDETLFARTSVQKVRAVYATVTTLLNVRSGPSANHDIIEGLKENTKVEVLESFPDAWVKIKYDGNKIGYVSSSFLKFND